MRELVLSKLQGADEVLILGFGREGQSTFRWFRKVLPDIFIGIADKNENIVENYKEIIGNARLHLGADYLKSITHYKVVIKSPGIAIADHWFKDRSIVSQTSLFLEKYRGQMIGITGTKGKSTTSALTTHILHQNGYATLLLGNIGTPAFDMLSKITAQTMVVYELSAHQLRDVHTSPHIGVLTNIFPEHLDFFGNFAAYHKAKTNIFRYQLTGDTAIDGSAYQQGQYNNQMLTEALNRFTGSLFSIDQIRQHSPLKGAHNLFNVILSISAAKAAGVPVNHSLASISSFKALPHRLEYVGSYQGISFYNDSISTVPQSAIAAVESIRPVDVLLLGGYDRGIDYTGLAEFLAREHIPYLFFFGKAGKVMNELLNDTRCSSKRFFMEQMDEALKKIKTLPHIKTVVLSPAAASYDAYHNFEHRGDTFKTLVRKYFASSFNADPSI